MTVSINAALYRWRTGIAAVALLFILYCAVYYWAYTPYDGFVYTWSPNTTLTVDSIAASALDDNPLQVGDEILMVNGRPVVRLRSIYPLPHSSTYEFTVQRGTERLTLTVPVLDAPTYLTWSHRLPATLLALLGWFTGMLILLFSQREQWQALHIGCIFLLASVVLMGLQASLGGVPLAWIGGHVLIFPLSVLWVYLGFLPRQTPLPTLVRRILFTGLFISGLLAAAAVIEAVYLFPAGYSWGNYSGIILYHLGFLLSAGGLLLGMFVLVWRLTQLPADSYHRRQLKILLVFIITGILPIILLTILPHLFLGQAWLPFPLSIALLTLLPAGYLFVIHRPGLLSLDHFFHRTLTLVFLSLIMFIAYMGFLWLIAGRAEGKTTLTATVLFFPLLIVAVSLHTPLNTLVQQLIYGEGKKHQEAWLNDTLSVLTTTPEPDTLRNALEQLSDVVGVTQLLLLYRKDPHHCQPLFYRGIPQPDDDIASDIIPALNGHALRAQDDPLFARFDWAALALPMQSRQRQTGVLIIGNPRSDGYFNAQQVRFLEQAVDILSMGQENIVLFETTRRYARERLAIREQERKNLSRQIHDEPLQRITYVNTLLDGLIADKQTGMALKTPLTTMRTHLDASGDALRRICMGLYPPAYEQGLLLALQEIIRYFQDVHDLHIQTESDFSKEVIAAVSENILFASGYILTEALNNVVKHTPNSDVTIRLTVTARYLSLKIQDNGPGSLVIEQSFTELVRQHHLGIVGMYEWADMVGGTMEIESNSPLGLSVLFTCEI